MRPAELAALGACKGAGESLGSWLAAGAMGEALLQTYAAQLAADDGWAPLNPLPPAYCPGCRVGTGTERRWYSRPGWHDPRRVVCSCHGLPLHRRERPPKQLIAPRLSADVRKGLFALSTWIEQWIAASPLREDQRMGFTPTCAADWALLDIVSPQRALTPFAPLAAEAQWFLWADGWPVPAGFRGRARYQLARVPRQGDRLALVILAWQYTLEDQPTQ